MATISGSVSRSSSIQAVKQSANRGAGNAFIMSFSVSYEEGHGRTATLAEEGRSCAPPSDGSRRNPPPPGQHAIQHDQQDFRQRIDNLANLPLVPQSGKVIKQRRPAIAAPHRGETLQESPPAFKRALKEVGGLIDRSAVVGQSSGLRRNRRTARAGVVKLVDTRVLGTRDASRGGSSPSARTRSSRVAVD